MRISIDKGDLLGRWLRFLAGLALLAGAVLFFSSGYSPPGIAGDVLRHNQECDIDASPLFYSEVENMAELEAGLKTNSKENRSK